MTISNSNNIALESFAHTAALSGFITQFSRSILDLSDPNLVLPHALQLLDSAQCHGFLKLSVDNEVHRSFVGQGVSRQFIKQLQSVPHSSDKIIANQHLLQIQTPNVYLILDLKSNSTVEKDTFVDQLAIFVDTLQAWCNNTNTKNEIEKNFNQQNVEHANQLEDGVQHLIAASNNLSESYRILVEEITLALIKSFPTMALEHDQEELILSLVESECRRHEQVVAKQLEENQSVTKVMQATIEQLRCAIPQAESKQQSSCSVELF